jgi:ribosomal protein S18 acetylase RimI-like enzyme
MRRAGSLEVRRAGDGDADLLGDFFEALAGDAETASFFRPHPLTRAFASELCGRLGAIKDCYYIAAYAGRAAGYMMLRGWDEGYAVPSFGVCTHPGLRGAGLGQALLAHAVGECRSRGAPRLRLTVYKANRRAVHVYEKFGFRFTDKNPEELVGVLDLDSGYGAPPPRPPDPAALARWAEGPAGLPGEAA